MKESTLSRVFVAAIAIVAAIASAIAFADERNVPQDISVSVTYADLDLTKESDANKLYRRLQQASEKICGVESLRNARTLREYSQMHQCYQQAMTAAKERLDND